MNICSNESCSQKKTSCILDNLIVKVDLCGYLMSTFFQLVFVSLISTWSSVCKKLSSPHELFPHKTLPFSANISGSFHFDGCLYFCLCALSGQTKATGDENLRRYTKINDAIWYQDRVLICVLGQFCIWGKQVFVHSIDWQTRSFEISYLWSSLWKFNISKDCSRPITGYYKGIILVGVFFE